MAGGLTEKAERGTMTILRHTNGREESLPVKLDSLVLPDDIIVVAEGQRFYISGEVKTPGRYLYETNLSVNKAISMAGGMTEKAESGTVKLTRLTGGQAHTIQAAPDASVLADDIIVVEPQNHKFYVSGEVRTPGGHPFKDGLNIQKAIAMAGGPTEKADRESVRVIRIVNGREEISNVTLNMAVYPDDTIVVPEGRRFYVSGEVKTAGRYLYEQGVTVQKAITMAGGFTEKADKTGMAVVRVNENTLQTMPVELDALILPDDLIVVAQIQKVYVNGEVKTPGGYAYEKGLTIHKAVTMAGGFTDKASERRIKVLRRINGEERSFRVKLEDPIFPEDIVVVPQSFF
jgi:protein involved in polysaccharide export with SLBB domain